MTERLYYTEAYLTEFDASVLYVQQMEDSRRAAVLDRTAFYPTSGGQPFDVGMLDGTRVVEVIEREDGTILHVFEGVLAEGPVHGRIDWNRRFEHMQQHTGQHVLSAAFVRLLNVRTLSFHLGSGASTIDLSREISAEEIARAEAEANRIVWEDRPVSVRFADAQEAARLPLRKEAAREGLLRLVDIQDFDLSACGGTHVSRTGAIGMIVAAGWERFRGGMRIEFLCGVRALRGYRILRDSVMESVRLLSVLPTELSAGIVRLQTEGKEVKRRLQDLQGRAASFEAAFLADRAESHGELRLVAQTVEGLDQTTLKAIAAGIAERGGHVAVLVSAPPPAAVVVARADGLAIDSVAILRQLTAKFGGKGGGRADLAQGGGLDAPVEDVIAYARSILIGLKV